MKIITAVILLFVSFTSVSGQNTKVDLVITNAKVLNVRTGKISSNRTVVVQKGIIIKVSDSQKGYAAKQTINAKGKLVTPGFIDTHIHPTDILGDYDKAPKNLAKDSLADFRKRISNEYLPYGTTTTLTMGQPESWVSALLEWQKNPIANYTDMYISGGALISKEKRVPYIAHTTVETPEAAKQQIIRYHEAGINHVKLYYRLQSPEFKAAFKAADSLGMRAYGHVGDFSPDYLNIDQTLDIGLINYEHIATIPNSIITSDSDKDLMEKQFKDQFGEVNSESRFLEYYLEQFRFIEANKKTEMEGFITRLAKKKVTISTTIHRLYELFSPTFFTQPKDSSLTSVQNIRCQENFAILVKYTKMMSDRGVDIRLGSDMADGGKVNISELILLCKYGFSVVEAFKIATINGAKAIGFDKEIGAVEVGKKANLIIWDKSPFENYSNFSSSKTVIKDGLIFSAHECNVL
nr:amidohydrolase family protein [Pedobacter panaciterrae]